VAEAGMAKAVERKLIQRQAHHTKPTQSTCPSVIGEFASSVLAA